MDYVHLEGVSEEDGHDGHGAAGEEGNRQTEHDQEHVQLCSELELEIRYR